VNYSKIYDIDFRELANLLTPPMLRRRRHIDWIETLLKPLEQVNFSLKKYRKDAIYKVTHNGQVVYLEKVLNDSFDPELRRIKIDDFPIYDPLWVYPESDEKPVYIDAQKPVYVYTAGSIFKTVDFDFRVLVPKDIKPASDYALSALTVQIRSLVNYYKLASKRYTIEWI
jgi:hypothetical protein